VIARLDVTSGVVVARRVEEQWDAPSLAVAQWAKDIVVGDRRSSTLKGYPAHLFDQDEALLKPSSLVSLGNAGVDELKISADGRYVAAVVGEGSELILVNWITGRVVSSFKLGSDDRATAGSLVNSMKMTMGTGETVNSLRTSVLYSLSPSPQISNTGYFLTFDVNEQFRSLDLVQSVLVKLGEAAGGVQARAVAGRRPVLMVASDEEQKVILVADSTSRRVLRFTRRANEIYLRGK
jgi:hypothetical protein